MSVLGLVAFLALVLTVLGLINYYIWRRAVRSTTRAGSRGRRIGTWIIIAAFLSTALAQGAGRLVSQEVAIPLAWVGFSWLGFAFYFFLFLLLGELIRLALRIFGGGPQTAAVDLPMSAAVPVAAPGVTGAGQASAEHGGMRTALLPDPAIELARTPEFARTPELAPTPHVVRTYDDRRNESALTTEPSRTTEASRLSGSAISDDEREVNRRLFLSRTIALGAGVAAASVGGYGISRAMGDPVVRRIPVQIASLDPALAGFRITMFDDAHLGSIRGKAVMERIVDIVNGTEPDLVAVVGDLVDGSVADLSADVAPIAGLQSQHGTYFVTGNHEYYSGAQEWVDFLPDLGVKVLRNERIAIERGGAAFDLAGVNDITGEDYDDSPDYEKALGGRRADRPVVLLCHQPVSIDRAVDFGVDLQLSGHTHGGQLWPFHYVVALQQGSASGLSRIGDTQLYVDSGVGFWGPPMRVGADPEITVIELNSRAGPDD